MFIVEANVAHEFPELRFIKDPVSISVHALELGDEVAQELLMLAELEVKHTFEEGVEFELGL